MSKLIIGNVYKTKGGLTAIPVDPWTSIESERPRSPRVKAAIFYQTEKLMYVIYDCETGVNLDWVGNETLPHSLDIQFEEPATPTPVLVPAGTDLIIVDGSEHPIRSF